MLKNKIIKCNIAVLIALGLVGISAVTYAYTPETTIEEGSTRNYQSVKNSSSLVHDGMQISYEDLATKKYIWCIEHGTFLPSVLSNSRPDRDATVEVNGMTRVVKELNASNSQLWRTRGGAYSVSPYGPNGTLVASSNTIAKYNTSGPIESTPSQAFIDTYSNSYEKSTDNYPNPVQSAVWIDLQSGGTTIESLNSSIASAANGGRDIAKAGQILESTMTKWNTFADSNNGRTMKDTTDYNKLKIGYNKNKGTIIVGPFTIDYVFSMYKPKAQLNGKLQNENGDFEFGVVKNLQFYADDAMTKEIRNYKIVYPDRSASTQDRIKLNADADTIYRYPLPGEQFYIEFSNEEYKDVNGINRLKATMQNMTAEGTHQVLTGTSDKINWTSKVDPIVCTNTHTIYDTSLCSQHPNHHILDGHARAYNYSVVGNTVATERTQPTKFTQEAKAPVHTSYVTTEMGQPMMAPNVPIYPIPFGWYRDDEPEYVPVLPINPDPNYPPYPPTPGPEPDPDPEIKLTFDLGGIVWEDEFLGKETLANGRKDADERGMQNIIVRLYKVGEDQPVKETLTDENGQYLFSNVRVGYDYYVEFTYDGMTYTNTKYMGSMLTTFGVGDTSALNEAYRANPENYLDASHAVESIGDRTAFNSKFMEISNGQALGTAGIIPLSYRTYMSEQGAVSALITTDNNYVVAEPFQITASTRNADLYYLLDDNYVAAPYDVDITNAGSEYYYKATYPGTLNVNLGLVKRDKADFAVKDDVYQTIVTMKENLQTFKYNDKTTNSLTYDAHTRNSEYYTDNVYTQKLDRADYNWRYDAAEYNGVAANTVSLKDEMNVYIEYKFLIRNQSPVLFGSVLELVNHFDSNLEYATSYDFTDMTSWIETNMVDEDGEVYREGITWDVVGTNNGYTTISTTGISDKVLVSGETIELHLILKVKKDAGRNIIMDLGENDVKDNILEINRYTFAEGTIDRDSNPGNVVIGNSNTFEDDTDLSPFVKLVFNEYPENNGQGKVISGYVWEDLANVIMENNMYTGNGVKDGKEKGIENVKVELIEVLMDKETGKEVEILKQLGDTYSIRTDGNGTYKFTNLPTGTYKVKFTYGDETQLKKDVTYNGQDYKSVSTDTLAQQYHKPSVEVMILADTSEGMSQNGRANVVSNSIKGLIEDLYNNVQTIKIGGALFSEPEQNGAQVTGLTQKPNKNNVLSVFDNMGVNTGTSLETAIDNSLAQYTASAVSKVMVICTDGYISSDAGAALNRAAAAGVKVISVVCSTDEWTINTFGTEENPTTGKLYYVRDVNIPEYITEVALEDVLHVVSSVLPNLVEAKDVQRAYNASVDSVLGDIYTRQRNIDYTNSMTYENATIVDGNDSRDITAFANNTQMTAITPVRNVMIAHNNYDTADANLGLIERPKVELQIREEIAGLQIKLSNGQVIIDTEKDLTSNVQIIPNAKYNIFLDDEIMQGATLTVNYKVTVFNNGHVDTLGEYYDYDMFNQADVAKYTASVATRVGTLYSYYTNLTFRAEDNSNMPIEINRVNTDAKTGGTSLTNWETYLNGGKVLTPKVNESSAVEVINAADGKPAVLAQKAMWENKSLVGTGVDDDDRIKNGAVKVIQTNSLSDVLLYPTISTEVLGGNGFSSVSTYVTFSKTISPNDPNDTLEYKQSVEIVERLNDLGRRDYIGVPGNYTPHAYISEYDSAKVEDIYILNPLGENLQTYFGLAAGAAGILGLGAIFIRRRIVK